MQIVLVGHKVAKGKASGEALVCKSPISFFGGVDTKTGVIVEKGHELEGANMSGKILVFPIGKGSTGGSYRIYELACMKKAPMAILCTQADPVVAVGAIISQIPMMDQLTPDPLQEIRTGDMVEVDADRGTVTVLNIGQT